MTEDIPEDARLLTYAELGELLGIEPESAKRRAVRHGWRRVPGNEGRTLVVVPRTAVPEHPPVPGVAAKPKGHRPGDGAATKGGDGPPDDPGDILGDAADRPGDMERAAASFAAAWHGAEALRAELLASERQRAEAEGRAAALSERIEAERRDAEARTRELAEANERARRAEARAEAAQGLADRRGEELAELRERVGRAEGEAETLREQLKAERNRSVTQMREVEAARDAAKAELAEWTAGGPLARALRALVYRRKRP